MVNPNSPDNSADQEGFPDFTEAAEPVKAKKSALDAGAPAVGASPGKTLAILVVLILGATSILYMVFGRDAPAACGR